MSTWEYDVFTISVWKIFQILWLPFLENDNEMEKKFENA